MRAGSPRAVTLATLVVGVVLVAPFATATLAPAQSSTDAPATAGSAASDVQTTTTTTTRGAPPDSARLVARYPAENGSMVERTVLAPDDVARVEPPVNASRGTGWRVPVTLSDAGAERFASTLVDAGFTDEPRDCRTSDGRNDEGHCLLVVVDGDVTAAFALGPSLARSIETGEFQDSPQLVLAANDESEAVRVWRGFLDDDGATTDGSSTATTSDDPPATTTSGAITTSRAATTSDAMDSAAATNESSATGSTTASDSTNGFGPVAGVIAAAVVAFTVARRGRD